MPDITAIHPDRQSKRLYYLDWLRVIAIFGVFLFHAVHPFDLTAWHIKNAEQSAVVTFFIAFMFPWGMPFFFLLAGAGSWFALRRRTAGEFARERFNRLMLPYIVGAILPFFVFHQPVIILLAYYAVQWQASLVVKLLFVVIGSFFVTLGICEFLIRRISLLRLVFGMKLASSQIQ